MIDVHALRIAYERVGDRPPLVLLHGYVGDDVAAADQGGPARCRPASPSNAFNKQLCWQTCLHEAISGSTLVVLPNAAHVCNIEAPEEFNRAVRSFLRVSPS
jgi:pimeloyl-ACP methyl ester carboxylesterase